MAWWFSFRQRVRAILRQREMELEMEEELQFHVDQAIERNMARGIDRAEARRLALKDFGGLERRKEQMRGAIFSDQIDLPMTLDVMMILKIKK